MSCQDALIKNVTCVTPETTVSEALDIIFQQEIRAVPVVDQNRKYHGMFSLHSLLDDLLPVAARMEGGVPDLGFVIHGSPGAAKRIRKISPLPVQNVIQTTKEEATLQPDTPLLEVIRRLFHYGSPLPVLDEEGNFVGLVSEQSCLSRLKELLKQVEIEENEMMTGSSNHS